MKTNSKLWLSAATGALMAAGSPALAQQSASAPPQGNNVAEVVVTGSRVATAGYDAPTPTTVLTAADIARTGATSVGDFLNELPSFRVSQNRQTAPQSSVKSGQVYADLRGLGSIRTLVLVDGRRFVPSVATGQVDLNLVPESLVSRVDVVTGGASAIYGSDAVSGVVNIILDKKLQGLKLDIGSGISTYNDDIERKVSGAVGTSFNGEKGHVVIGGDYVKSDGVGSYLNRPWGRQGAELISLSTRDANTPSRFFASGTQFTNATVGGVIVGVNSDTNAANGKDVLRGIQFGPGGAVQSFNYGTDTTGIGTSYNNSSDGPNSRLGHQLILPEDRKVLMAHVDYDFTDALSGFVEGSYAKAGGHFNGPAVRDTSTSAIVIKSDNAYLPTAVRNIMLANNIASFPMGRNNIDWAHSVVDNFSTTQRYVAGLSGKLPYDWKWDASVDHGQNTYANHILNSRIEANFKFAQDAVVNPANGQIVCRATLPGASFNAAAAGCVPINLFGFGSPSAAAQAYSTGAQKTDTSIKQDVAELNLHGDLFHTWAGPIAVATGASYRKDQTAAVSDPIAQAGGYNFGNAKAFAGSIQTNEIYGEILTPLAKDAPFFKSLDFNGAVRSTDYSTSGRVTTWKLGLTWEPITSLKFRAVSSRDIRAPNTSELFANTTSMTTLTNTFNGQTKALLTINQPSPTLKPEQADTKTFGVVLAPTFLPRFHASIDYFDITIKGAISSYAPQFIIDQCAAEAGRGAPATFCSFVSRTGTGAATEINSVSVQLLNIASLKSSGVDFDASYRQPLGDGALLGRFNGTYTAHLISDDGLGNKRTYNAAGILVSKGSVIDRAGQVGGFVSGNADGATSIPHWQLNGSLTYSIDRFSGTVQGRYVGGGKVDKTLVDPSEPDYSPLSPISVLNNNVESRFYVNLQASYMLIKRDTKTVQVYGSIDNLMNLAPPFPASQLSGLYDREGRYYRLGVRLTY